MNGVQNINSIFDEKINDDVSQFVSLLEIYHQNINNIFKKCWQTQAERTFFSSKSGVSCS